MRNLILLAASWIAVQSALFADSEHGELPPRARRVSDSSASAGPNPFEATVTPEEATLLKEAVEEFATDPEAAIERLERARDEEGSPAIDFALGNFYFQEERYEEAAAAYEAAIAKLPLFRRALNNLGRVHLIRDDARRAVETFQTLLRSGQADADMLVLLGHAHLLLDRPVSAENAYRQALTLRAEDTDAMRGLIKSLLEQHRTEEVVALSKELLAVNPTDGDIWALRANAELLADRSAAAVVTIESARRLGWARPELLATLGDLYLNRRQPREAVSAYEEAFAQDAGPSLDRLLRAAEGFLMLDALDGAQQLLETAREREQATETLSQHVKRQWLEAELASARGRFDRARELYQAIIREDPLHGEAILALAEWEIARGDPGRARLLFEQAARIEGYEARALAQRARMEVERGNYRQAVKLLESAQTFDPRPQVARYLQQVRRLAQ